MIHTNKIIVLKATKFGETSLIVSAFTELFGKQDYLVQGVRKASKGTLKANLYLPGNILQASVYHIPNKNLQRIKDANFEVLQLSTKESVVKNAVLLMMMEMIVATLHQTETNQELFDFFETQILFLDSIAEKSATWLPHYFALQFAGHLGFGLHEPYHESKAFLNLQEGEFNALQNNLCSNQAVSKAISDLYYLNQNELPGFINNEIKNTEVLRNILLYFKFHLPEMNSLKSIEVLEAIFS
jgi:DNA repair protein RecO (recombination protein O)